MKVQAIKGKYQGKGVSLTKRGKTSIENVANKILPKNCPREYESYYRNFIWK